jgi:hypothetical protein
LSKISDIFQSYKTALSDSRDKYTKLYTDRIENGRNFHEEFFNRLIIPFRPRFTSSSGRQYVQRQIERFFGTTHIDFVAIDGTCDKDAFNDFMVFFGGAYGSKGRVSLEGEPPKVRYEKWEINKDVSMVAWMPVPFAEIYDVSNNEETFVPSDIERINTSSIHTQLMQLAEVYLAYNAATGSAINFPRLILLDTSLSSMMAATSHGAHTKMPGCVFAHRTLRDEDVTVAFAHPFNPELGIPTAKEFGRQNAILALFDQRKTDRLPIAEIGKALELDTPQLRTAFKRLRDNGVCDFDETTREMTTTLDVRESWAFTTSLFQKICTRLFIDKDQSALLYDVQEPEDSTKTRKRWMSQDDINFLIAVGLRLLIEVCWQKKILLVGIAKDSASRYLTGNYLGIAKAQDLYSDFPARVGLLPPTDRIYLETVPAYCDETLDSPWATIEIDSTFMTVVAVRDELEKLRVSGTKTPGGGEIVAPERLFLRSLGQFFLSRSKKTPLMGHVIFVDRLAFPAWDKAAISSETIGDLGGLRPLMFNDNNSENIGQLVMMYLLNTLTKNHFPEMIGYPDPLHKADWGAKSVARRVKDMIRSSEIYFRSNPIAKTLRSIRDARHR